MSRKERSFSTVRHTLMDTRQNISDDISREAHVHQRHLREQSCFILNFKTYHIVQTKVSIHHTSKGLKQNHQKIEEISIRVNFLNKRVQSKGNQKTQEAASRHKTENRKFK